MKDGASCFNFLVIWRLMVAFDLSWDPIIKYIKDQHSAYLRKELTAQRERHIQDTRIHCCLYFINPTGHSLRPVDIIVMKMLSDVVNVVPVIAKSDSLTLEERERFKAKVRSPSFRTFETLLMIYFGRSRFAKRSYSITSVSIPLTLMRLMKRRSNSMSLLGYAPSSVSG